MRFRNMLFALATVASLGVSLSPPAEAHKVIEITVAPPEPRVVVVPAPRHGKVWAPGYWAWNGHRHVWVEGRWMRERRDAHWVPAHWEESRHGYYHFEQGHWERG